MLMQERLANGVHVVVKENTFAPVVAVQCWVGVGSIHEGPSERGMAHFIEHMLFKGTARRKVGEIGAAVESAGGEINAYTTFDHTVFHLTMPAEHASLAIDLLADAIATSSFDPDEVEREREVILEEVRRSLDQPGSIVGRKLFELCYAGCELERPIIGSAESVAALSRAGLFDFYKRFYRPDNLTVVVVGDVDGGAALAHVREHFGQMTAQPGRPPRDAAEAVLKNARKKPAAPRACVLKGDYQQARIEVALNAPSIDDVDTASLDLAAFALGSGELGRLNRRLRDGDGVVTSIGASVYSPRYDGMFELSAFTAEGQMLAAVGALGRELALLRGAQPVSEEELARARACLRSERVSRDETVEAQARVIGHALRTSQGLVFDDVYMAQIEHLPASSIADAVTRWLRPEQAVIVALVPDGTELSEEQLTEAWARGLASAAAEAAAAAPPARGGGRGARQARQQAELIDIAPGVRLVYRQNVESKMLTVVGGTEGGLRGESAADAGVYNAMASMLGLATKRHGYESCVGFVEERGASLDGFSGKDSLGISVQALSEHTDALLDMYAECLLEPHFPEEQWAATQRELLQSFKAMGDSPARVAMLTWYDALLGEHPYRFPSIGTAATVGSFTAKSLCARFQEERDGGPWVFAATGPSSAALVAAKLGRVFAGFKPATQKRQFSSAAVNYPAARRSLRLAKDREQSHLVYGFLGVAWNDSERAALDVLVNVLGGHGGRLFRKLRDQDSLAYSVAPLVTYGVHRGLVGSYIACAPPKAQQALSALEKEMLALTREPPRAEELERARNFIVGSHEMGLQRSDAQASTMALMELYGYGHDDYLRYPKAVARVSAEDVLAVARRVFIPEQAVDVTVGPE